MNRLRELSKGCRLEVSEMEVVEGKEASEWSSQGKGGWNSFAVE